jgi:hypothetical protein
MNTIKERQVVEFRFPIRHGRVDSKSLPLLISNISELYSSGQYKKFNRFVLDIGDEPGYSWEDHGLYASADRTIALVSKPELVVSNNFISFIADVRAYLTYLKFPSVDTVSLISELNKIFYQFFIKD